jgi:hypothetical protein
MKHADGQTRLPNNAFLLFISYKEDIVTCIPIARQRLGKHIQAAHEQAAIGHPLIGNGPVNTPP